MMGGGVVIFPDTGAKGRLYYEIHSNREWPTGEKMRHGSRSPARRNEFIYQDSGRGFRDIAITSGVCPIRSLSHIPPYSAIFRYTVHVGAIRWPGHALGDRKRDRQAGRPSGRMHLLRSPGRIFGEAQILMAFISMIPHASVRLRVLPESSLRMGAIGR